MWPTILKTSVAVLVVCVIIILVCVSKKSKTNENLIKYNTLRSGVLRCKKADPAIGKCIEYTPTIYDDLIAENLKLKKEYETYMNYCYGGIAGSVVAIAISFKMEQKAAKESEKNI